MTPVTSEAHVLTDVEHDWLKGMGFYRPPSPPLIDIGRALDTGELTVRDVKGWVFAREDVLAYLCGFTEARMIISSLEVRKMPARIRPTSVLWIAST